MSRKNYKKLFIFENKRRILLLEKYLSLVSDYFNNISYPKYTGGYSYSENDKAKIIRPNINKDTNEICDIFDYTPYAKDKWLILNIYNLQKFHTSHNNLIDSIERVIGVYKKDTNLALVRTIFFPLFYFIWFIEYFFFLLSKSKEFIFEIIKLLNKL